MGHHKTCITEEQITNDENSEHNIPDHVIAPSGLGNWLEPNHRTLLYLVAVPLEVSRSRIFAWRIVPVIDDPSESPIAVMSSSVSATHPRATCALRTMSL